MYSIKAKDPSLKDINREKSLWGEFVWAGEGGAPAKESGNSLFFHLNILMFCVSPHVQFLAYRDVSYL